MWIEAEGGRFLGSPAGKRAFVVFRKAVRAKEAPNLGRNRRNPLESENENSVVLFFACVVVCNVHRNVPSFTGETIAG
jgi:hypothetical protein